MLYLVPEIYRMWRSLHSSRQGLDRTRIHLFKAQIENIYHHVPFYRDVFEKRGLVPEDFRDISDIKKLPILTKEDIRDHFEEFLNDKINTGKCFQSHTSGSTGEPFWSYFDKRTWVRKKYLSKLRARFACGMRPGEKVVIFETDKPENLERLNRKLFFSNFFLNVSYFSIFEDIAKGLEKIQSFKPQNAYGPPSYFFQLAQLVKEKNRPVFSLKRIYTSSEYLESPVQQFIRDELQVDIFDVYGSTEFKEVAWECEQHEGYHINEDEVICEILNDKTPAPPGETAIEKCEGLTQYQFIQETPTLLTLNVILDNKRGKDLVSKIKALVTEVTKGMMQISIKECQKIVIEENGKFKVVKNLVDGQQRKS